MSQIRVQENPVKTQREALAGGQQQGPGFWTPSAGVCDVVGQCVAQGVRWPLW